MVPPASRRIPRVRRYSGTMAREGLPFRLRDFHPLRSPFPVTLLAVRLEKAFVTPRGLRSGPHHRPTTPRQQRLRPYTVTVWAPPRSLAATRGISTSPFGGRARLPKETGVDFSSSRYWDVSLRGVRLRRLCIRRRMPHLVGTAGCPIRESPDHSLLSGSPRLIAAGHALHRLRLPRDPPSALTMLA